MSSVALRRQAVGAYRDFIRTAHSASVACGVTNQGGLETYCRNRFRSVANRNKELKTKRKLVEKQIDMVRMYTSALAESPEHPALVSMLQVLAANIGSPVYQRSLEKGFVDYLDYVQQQRQRHEADEQQVSDRQNKILQVALRQYADNLVHMHDTSLTQEQMKERLTSARAAVSIHALHHGREDVVVEIDEDLNKQVIYVRCEDYDFNEEIERLEVVDAEQTRNTVAHAEWYSIALRLVEAIKAETPLHRSRGTVIVGHGVGGAVGLGMSILLQTTGFDVKNCISFGSPKLLEDTLVRTVEAISPIRVVISGDPLPDLPVTGSSGDPFKHFGEILTLDDRVGVASAEAAGSSNPLNAGFEGFEDPAEESKSEDATPSATSSLPRDAHDPLRFTMQHYAELVNSDTVDLAYGLGEEVWDHGDFKQMVKSAHSQLKSEKLWN